MKVIIVDDHSLFRSGLVNLFSAQPDFQVVGEAGNLKEMLSLVEDQNPDLILMDLGLPDGLGIDALPKILNHNPDANIVFLTIHASDENAFAALRNGARGFLLKDISAQALLSALRRLERGELAVSRAVLSRFVKEYLPFITQRSGDKAAAGVTLTLREVQILSELSAGESNPEIASRLSITENTVKVHIHHILNKLKLQNRQEAAAYARRLGLSKRDN